jgi:pimeloyl-ACP methyl ester carboxylesterase
MTYDNASYVLDERPTSITIGKIDGSSSHVTIRSTGGDVSVQKIDGSSNNILIEAHGSVVIQERIDGSSSAIIRSKYGSIIINQRIDGCSNVTLEAPNGIIQIGERIDGGSVVRWFAQRIITDIRSPNVSFVDVSGGPRSGLFHVTDPRRPIFAPAVTGGAPRKDCSFYEGASRYLSQAGDLGLLQFFQTNSGLDYQVVEPFAAIARLKDAAKILTNAAALHYWAARGQNPLDATKERADRVADLAVTGRSAYRTFSSKMDGTRRVARNLSESDIPIGEVKALIKSQAQDHGVSGFSEPSTQQIKAAIQLSLDRAFTTAWSIRGPQVITDSPTGLREIYQLEQGLQPRALGWLGISPLDDPPHRAVNVPRSPFVQSDIRVWVPRPHVQKKPLCVEARYICLSEGVTEPAQKFDIRSCPKDTTPFIPIDHDVVVFIHGHSSSGDELGLFGFSLLNQWRAAGRKLTVLAVDLPSNGYSEMIEHTEVAPSNASNFNTGYPILEFIEEFIVRFVDAVDKRQQLGEAERDLPSLGIKDRIVGVLGGSLGGNMTLRLSRRPEPWLKRNMVAWSAASIWGASWALATKNFLAAANPNDRIYFDVVKADGFERTRRRYDENEAPGVRAHYFDLVFGDAEIGELDFLAELFMRIIGEGGNQASRWLPDDYPCKAEMLRAKRIARYETYNPKFRRWHWRVAHEQLIYMHGEVVPTSEQAKYGAYPGSALYDTHLLLAAGTKDNEKPDKIFDHTVWLTHSIWWGPTRGRTLWVDAGHSIHSEHPDFFAQEILEFMNLPAPRSSCELRGQLIPKVNSNWCEIAFADVWSAPPVVLAAMQSSAGMDTAGLRIRDVSKKGLSLFVEEERSRDEEVGHVDESVALLLGNSGVVLDTSGKVVGEVGSFSLAQATREAWTSKKLRNSYKNPVVVAQITSYNGGDPCHVRIKSAAANAFDLKIEEWKHLDGPHVAEVVSFGVFEAGKHQLPGDAVVQVGTLQANHNWVVAELGVSFAKEPLVFAQCQTFNGSDPIVVRQRGIQKGRFELRLQEEEAGDQTHFMEQVGWVALGFGK